MTCTTEYANRLIKMKAKGMVPSLSTLVLMDTEDLTGFQTDLNLLTYTGVVDAGQRDTSITEFDPPTKDDVYILSYTSGTTGDPKGVKLTHNNVLANARTSILRIRVTPGEALISYLPYTHSFEQALFAFGLETQCKIGYYTGDPTRIVSDCQALQPSFFPSVPRLYNKIYASLQAGISNLTGCKRFLADYALRTKITNYEYDGRVTHGCWDGIIFKKFREMLGGKVRHMVTGSAPIEKQVIDFLKVVFSCPIVEGYGLTETSAGGCVMEAEDMLAGHVGGPIETVKIRLRD